MGTSMLVEHKGLNCLLRACAEPACSSGAPAAAEGSMTLQNAAAHSLLYLAQELQVEWEQREYEHDIDLLAKTRIGQEEHDVTFVFDDGTRVTGNREVIVAGSSVFDAMLEGAFQESEEKEISIRDTDPDAFRVLVNHFHNGDLYTSVAASGAVFPAEILDILLQTLALADRYMVRRLETEVKELICAKYMSKATVMRIFEVAVLHRSDGVVRECFLFVLSGQLSLAEASPLLMQMVTGRGQEVLDVLHNIIMHAVAEHQQFGVFARPESRPQTVKLRM